jgi:hypothetical protein
MSLFTHVDAIDASNYLQAVAQPNGATVENFIMKVTGFSDNGAAVMPKGFDTDYGLYLTLDAVIVGGVFETLNATLWADPKNNDGTPSATTTGIGFSNGTSGDIALATGNGVGGNDAQFNHRSTLRQFRGESHTDVGRLTAVWRLTQDR